MLQATYNAKELLKSTRWVYLKSSDFDGIRCRIQCHKTPPELLQVAFKSPLAPNYDETGVQFSLFETCLKLSSTEQILEDFLLQAGHG